MNKPLWTPGERRIDNANMSRFIRFVRTEHDTHVTDYASLYEFSIQKPGLFWTAVWEFCGIRASITWDEPVTGIDQMPGANWFFGARLNFAQNLLRYKDHKPAIVFRGEDGSTRKLSYAQLNAQVAQLAAALKDAGVESGDRVAGFLPNLPETIIAMLATASLGAVWSSCSPDFGINGVVDRFGQIEPKVLFAADGYFYNGKGHDSLQRVEGILERIPTIERVVIVPYREEQPDITALPKAILLNDFVAGQAATPITFEQLPFDHPLYIMYSSGTTGVPKCIVHGAGGTLIQHLKELVLHTDLKREDNIFYFTTCGWMMWNWLVSSLAVGATVVLYDGNPFYPDGNTLWNLTDELEISIFGASAKYYSAVEKTGLTPRITHDLNNLKTLLSTGSPLAPEQFDFVYGNVKENVCLSSISGGTDIVSCFALGNPILPVWRGELQCIGLGMKVEVLNDEGEPIKGAPGELACAMPFPSMPVKFWNDPDGTRYHDAYFSRVPGYWCHGDLVEITAHDGMIIYGRSDATLNPGGVRIGTAEIYRQVEKHEEVLESLAVGQKWEGDERVILFVRLREGMALDDNLVQGIRQTIRRNATPRHVPAKIVQVPDIPRTISGKIVELAVRNIIHGKPVKNRDALANPEALEHYQNLPQLS